MSETSRGASSAPRRPGTGTRRAARPRVALTPMWPVAGGDPAIIDRSGEDHLLSPWRDGWRCLVVLDDRVRMRGRAGRDLTQALERFVDPLAASRARAGAGTTTVLDALAVAPGAGGDGADGAADLAACEALDVVDVLVRDGRDVTALALSERQRELRELRLRERDGVRVLPAWRGSASAAWEQSVQGGRAAYSGILARRARSPYRPGVRSDDWVAFVERPLEELLLCGITRSGALVLAMPTSHGLAFAGLAWPTRDWSVLAARCREGAPAFEPPAIWPSLGPIAWAKPELWVAVARDVRPSSGRGGPRWRFVRVQEDLAP
ncbi:MAG TPA: hypothetical protein VFD92_22740 [Candidatus Binatia bacterium]|nr:hypothetical protein [Candidatus Binatia bacterium]